MKNKSIKHAAIALLAFVFSIGSLNAAINTTVFARAVDNNNEIGGYFTNGTALNFGDNVSIGTSNGGDFWAGLYVFQLPDLQGETFSNASFTVDIDNKLGNPGNADVFGLRISNSNAVSAADFNAAGTTLFSDFLVDGTHDQGNVVSRNNDATFNNWLGTNYVAGNYAVIAVRLKTKPADNNVRWFIDDGDASAPRILFSSVPEPATYALIFGGLSLGFVMVRRRRIKG